MFFITEQNFYFAENAKWNASCLSWNALKIMIENIVQQQNKILPGYFLDFKGSAIMEGTLDFADVKGWNIMTNVKQRPDLNQIKTQRKRKRISDLFPSTMQMLDFVLK